MEQNKWKLEELEGDDWALTNGKITIATSNVEDEYLRAILVLLNNCGGDFHSENELERDLGVQLQIASYELDRYKARAERMEQALNAVIGRNMPVPNKVDMIKIAREALGLDKALCDCTASFKAAHGKCYKCPIEQEGEKEPAIPRQGDRCPECGAPCKIIEKTYQEEIHDVHYVEHQYAPQQGAVTEDAHEKEVMMKAFDDVRKIFEGRAWIMEGRGSYTYNDDRYKEEVRYLYNEFDAIQKATWAKIKSKSIDYRHQIIADYLNENKQQGPVWVKGAPMEMKPHYAKVPSRLYDHLTYKAIIIPKETPGYWWAVGDGFSFALISDEIIEHLDEGGEKEVNNG